MDLPKFYGATIIGCGVAPFVASTIMGGAVMAARKKYDVHYPNLYAVKARDRQLIYFSCHPRARSPSTTLTHHPHVLPR